MRTLRLKTNQRSLIANLRYAFNQSAMLGELLQNARRAQASTIQIAVDKDSLRICDDGIGIADLQSLIFIAESGWSEQLKARENAFGLGVLSTLYFADRVTVHSGNKMFSAHTSDIIAGEPVEERVVSAYMDGAAIHLEGVKSVCPGQDLSTWVENELQRLCAAFPVAVWLNGVEIARPLASPALPWRETPMGKVLVNLSTRRTHWCCFLQGLPIGRRYLNHDDQVVLLPDNILAKLPDRQHLLNEAEDYPRIQAAVDQAYREALLEKKQELAVSDFISQYADVCLSSSNADLLNDVPYVPVDWFRDWSEEPAGFRQYWGRYRYGNRVVSQETLEATGVWQIESDSQEGLIAEVYLEAAGAYVLDQTGLDDDHWLNELVRVVTPEQVRVRAGTTLHQDVDPGLADYEVGLELVDTLHVGLAGHPGALEYAVDAVRMENKLYLTTSGGSRTRLVSDYVFDDRYNEDREDEDAQLMETFIAVGSSLSADRVVQALLPYRLRHCMQPKLAGATVQLIFDNTGKLQAVTV